MNSTFEIVKGELHAKLLCRRVGHAAAGDQAGLQATKTPEPQQVPGSGGGGWGIRTPEGLHPTRFPSVRHRPLGESSVHIVPDNHKRKKPLSANPGQWTRSQARNPAKNRAPRQAGKQANRQTHTHTFLGSPRQFSGIETAGARQLDHRLPGCTREGRPPRQPRPRANQKSPSA